MAPLMFSIAFSGFFFPLGPNPYNRRNVGHPLHAVAQKDYLNAGQRYGCCQPYAEKSLHTHLIRENFHSRSPCSQLPYI